MTTFRWSRFQSTSWPYRGPGNGTTVKGTLKAEFSAVANWSEDHVNFDGVIKEQMMVYVELVKDGRVALQHRILKDSRTCARGSRVHRSLQ